MKEKNTFESEQHNQNFEKKVRDVVETLTKSGHEVSLGEDAEYFILHFSDGRDHFIHKWPHIMVEKDETHAAKSVPVEDIIRARIMYPNDALQGALDRLTQVK